MNKILETLIFILFLILSIRGASDFDLWFQLLAGYEFLNTLQIPKAEFYIYSSTESTIFGGWGYGVISAIFYKIGGILLLTIINAMYWGIIFLFLYKALFILKKENINNFKFFSIVCIVLGLIYIPLATRSVFRAEVFSYIFLSFYYYLFILQKWNSSDSKQNQTKNYFFFFTGIAPGVLALIHTTSILLIYTAFCFFLLRLLAIKNGNKLNKQELSIWATSLSCALIIPFCNPNGIVQVAPFLLEWIEYIKSGGIVESIKNTHSIATATGLQEYAPSFSVSWAQPMMILILCFYILSIFFSKQKMFTILIATPFVLGALMHVRMIGFAALTLTIPIYSLLECNINNFNITKFKTILISVIMSVLLILYTYFGGLFGYGLSEKFYPLKAMEILKQQKSGTNIFNFFHLGSWFAFELGKGWKVAVDGHFLKSGIAQKHYYKILNMEDGWEKELKDYNVNVIILPPNVPFANKKIPLTRAIYGNPEWQIISNDQTGFMFIRKSIMN